MKRREPADAEGVAAARCNRLVGSGFQLDGRNSAEVSGRWHAVCSRVILSDGIAPSDRRYVGTMTT
jgi:hypothetical protein